MRHQEWEAHIQEFAQRWGLNFQHPALLQEALTHPSYHGIDPNVPDNQRLEFLGDAVLDLVVGEWLYHHQPDIEPRELTDYRAALVHRRQLAAFARMLELGPYIRVGRGALQKGRGAYERILADTFEALVAAVYLDQGLDAVRRFILPLVEKTFPELLKQGAVLNYKGLLQEWSQHQGFGTPKYRVVEQKGAPHRPCFSVEVWINGKRYGRGQGYSRKEAEKAAARDALQRLGLLEPAPRKTPAPS